MRSSWEVLHTFIAIALTAPILVFYLVIAGEALGYSQPTERHVLVAPTAPKPADTSTEPQLIMSISAFNQICIAMAKGTNEDLK
jgi:hypothetical protein